VSRPVQAECATADARVGAHSRTGIARFILDLERPNGRLCYAAKQLLLCGKLP